GHVRRAYRRARPHRRGVRQSAPPVHAGPARGGTATRPSPAQYPDAAAAGRRGRRRRQRAVGMSFPSAVSVRPGDLSDRVTDTSHDQRRSSGGVSFRRTAEAGRTVRRRRRAHCRSGSPDMRKPLYQEAQQRLRDYILDHDLSPGAALPPEAELAKELGISRLSLREATQSLETLGVVRAVAGRGLYVSEFSFAAVLQQLPYSFGIGGHSLMELLQVREAIERGLIVTVSGLMSEDDLAELDGIVDEMAAAYQRNETFAE